MTNKTYRQLLLENREKLALDGIIVTREGDIKEPLLTKPREPKVPWMKKRWSTFN